MEQLYVDELALLRFALWGEPLHSADAMDWEALVAELQQQAVLGLVSCERMPPEVPADVRARLQERALRHVAGFYRYLAAQDHLFEVLRDSGTSAVVLKGAAAAVAYPHPERRSMGDIDFLVPPQLYEPTFQLLVANGYGLKGEKDDNPKHIELARDGVSVELHRSFGDFKDPQRVAAMARRLEHGLANAQEAACEGSTFPMLPALENGLVLLRHMAQHLNAGLGLRQVIDWMMFVHAHLDDELWEGGFAQAAAELGLDGLAVAATRACQLYLGLPDRPTWCPEGEQADALATELACYVLEVGNFGRKQDKTSAAMKSHLSKAGSGGAGGAAHTAAGILRQVDDSARSRHPWARRHAALRPFAWVYTAGRFVVKALGRKGAVESIRAETASARRRRSLLERLGVTDSA